MAGENQGVGAQRGRKRQTILLIIFVLALGAVYSINSVFFQSSGQAVGLTGSDEPTPAAQTVSPTATLTAPVQSQTTVQATGTIEPQPTETVAVPTPTPTVPLPTPDPWEGDKRVNILVLGLDHADWDSPDRAGPPRSDTMILLSVDPVSKTAAMISIPRDLWVDIPGMIRPNKINAAHRFGELYKLPGGGPALASRTVERLLDVRIDYYARIDFRAFEHMIDEIGGVVIDVPEEIKVDPIGPNNTVILQPGTQRLDGPVALAYARNRSTPGNDLARAIRQQQVIMAIRTQVLKWDRLPRLILKAPNLFHDLSEGIVTNLTVEQAIQLAWLVPQISSKDIHSAVIGPNQAVFDFTEDGQSIMVPVPERIQYLVRQVFAGQK